MRLEAKGVCRRYFRQGRGTNFFYALKPTDLCLTGGTLTVVTGRSGSGKSTLLNVLAGLLAPTEGSVTLETGERCTDLYALRERERSALRNRLIGVIPQGQTGLASLTVLENVCLPARIYGQNPGVEKEAMALLERLGIDSLRDVCPGELSGGEARRMAIARALIMKPRFVLADEPTGDLDDANTALVLTLFRDCADAGAAVLLVTHESEAISFGDVCCHMDGGTLTAVPEAGV